jgi:hypothetical protein
MDTTRITLLSDVNDVSGDFVIKVRVVRVWRQYEKLDPTQLNSIEAVLMDEQVSMFTISQPFYHF